MNRNRYLVGLGILFATAACTAIYDDTSTQCRSQEDCLARGPEFADTTCTAQRVCEKIVTLETACTSNQACIDANGPSYTCRKKDGKCVDLLSPDCQTLYADKEDLIDDNMVVMGSTVPNDENGRQAGFAMEMARTEIKRTGSLPAATPDGPRRPLVLVNCVGESNGLATARRQYLHLADNVQTPFYAGPFASPFVLVGSNIMIPRNILTLTTNAIIDITSLQDNDLVFRAGFSDTVAIPAMNGLITEHILPEARTSGMLGATEPIRVVVLRTLDAPGLSAAAEILNTLRFNGKSVAENQADGNFASFDVGLATDPVGHPYPENERNEGVTKALAFKPHVVIYPGVPTPPNVLGGDTGWLALNRAWLAQMPGTPLPYGITINQGWQSTIIPLMNQLRNEEARKKFFGVRGQANGWNPPDFGKWVNLVKATFNDAANAALTPLAALSYDRVYLFAYALGAIGNAPVQGPELARGLRRVAGSGGGTPIMWGTADYSKGLAELAAGRDISFIGLDGQFAFDEKGDRPGVGEVFCINTVKGAPTAAAPTGFTVDPKTGTSKGKVVCPDVP